MFSGLIIAATVVSVIVLVVVLFVQRGREGVDLSARTLLRAYLYAASFAGLVALVFGLSALLNWGIAQAAGTELVYGGVPKQVMIEKPCPPGVTGCVQPSPEQLDQQRRQLDEQRKRQVGEELLRGITFTVIGAVFYGAHYAARRGAGVEEAGSALGRGYRMLGTAVFGLATIVLVPTGLYQLLANALLQTPENSFRPGIADSFAPGVVSLVVWLVFLRLVIKDTRAARSAA